MTEKLFTGTLNLNQNKTKTNKTTSAEGEAFLKSVNIAEGVEDLTVIFSRYLQVNDSSHVCRFPIS